MKGATQCAKKLRDYVKSLKSEHGSVTPPAGSDPITQLVIGVLSRNVQESKAYDALDKLRSMVVDYNELRVIPAGELAEILDDFPDARVKAEDICRALHQVFMQEHAISLDSLKEIGKKEAKEYLDAVDGLDAYSRARIRLLGLQGHAVPLDEAMWALARKEALVDPKCSLEEAQSFLERQISDDEALEFFAMFQKEAWAKMASAVKKGSVEKITSIPPERVTSHMLQDITPTEAPVDTLDVDKVVEELGDIGGPEAVVEETASTTEESDAKKSTGKKAKKAKKAEKADKVEKAPKAAKPKKTTKKSESSAKKKSTKKAATKKTTKKVAKNAVKKTVKKAAVKKTAKKAASTKATTKKKTAKKATKKTKAKRSK